MEEYDIEWKDLIIAPFYNPLTNDKLHFATINYTLDYTLYPKFWIFVQVNNKLNVAMQSVTRVIV